MKLKGTHKPSLIILGRTTLALMLVTIAAVSFGAGYFTGYQFTSSGSDDRPVLTAGSRTVLPPDEKRVLEPTPAPVAATAQPVPHQAPAQGQPAQQPQNQTAQPLISVKPSAPEAAPTPPGKSEPKVAMAEKPAPAKPAEVKPEEPLKAPAQPQASVPQKPAPATPAKAAETPAKAEKKKAAAKQQTAAPKRGGYAVQFGAFAEPPKAEQLKKALLAKGIKAYILPKDKKSSYARVRAGSFARHDQAVHYAEVCKTKGFAGFVTK